MSNYTDTHIATPTDTPTSIEVVEVVLQREARADWNFVYSFSHTHFQSVTMVVGYEDENI